MRQDCEGPQAGDVPLALHFTSRTQKALRVLGELIQEWSYDREGRPGRPVDHERMLIEVRKCVEILRERGPGDTALEGA